MEIILKAFVMTVLLLIGVWWVNYYGNLDIFSLSAQGQKPSISALAKAGDECVAISERASAHLIPKLEFQRLELAARKANVVVRCMADRHFYQSPVWLKYAQPIAAKISSQQHISIDAAIENLKRADMLIFQPQANKPAYWQYIKNKD